MATVLAGGAYAFVPASVGQKLAVLEQAGFGQECRFQSAVKLPDGAGDD